MATILITGIGRGIGRALAETALARGHRVIGTTRDGQADFSHPELSILALDVGDGASVKAAAVSISEPIDVVINNAGVFGPRPQELASADVEDLLDVFNINVAGPWRVLQAFLPNLHQSKQGRVLMVSSGMGRFSGSSVGAPIYRSSKAALNKLVQTFATDLKGQNIAIVACHPGWVKTDMGGAGAEIEASESAFGLVTIAETLTLEMSGCFLDWNGTQQDW